jgi:hypothetical protein
MSAKDSWTPYGLEAIRIRYLRRRRILSILIALSLGSVWLLMFETTTSTQTDIFVNGERQGNGIQIDEPEQQRDGPVTVAVQPGRVTRAESGGPGEEQQVSRTSAPTFSRAPPVPFDAFIIIYGPFILLAMAAYFLAKKKGKHDQVNYGIYKGAMPLELVSASMSKHVFTTRMAKTGLFGKRRADHLPDEILAVERVPQEEA